MKKIAVFTGAWGWGPITTAEMILQELTGKVEVTTFVDDIAATYASERSSHFGRVVPSGAAIECMWQFDIILSVVEPVGPLIGHLLGIPVVAVDNLFWHWDWPEIRQSDLEAIIGRVRSLEDVAPAIDVAASLGLYAEYSVMYAAATEVHWQRVAGDPEDIPAWMRDRATWVAPFIGTLPTRCSQDERHTIVVSLSGGLINPYTSQDQLDIYCQLLGAIFCNFRQMDQSKIVFAAPRQLHARLRREFGEVSIAEYSRVDFLKLISSAAILFAPAGLSTTFEAVALGVLLVTLPDQHDGNYANYYGLSGLSGGSRAELESVFPTSALARFSSLPAETTTEQLFADYAAALENIRSGFIPWAADLINAICGISGSARTTLCEAQSSLLGSVEINASGEKFTASRILKLAGRA